MPDEFIILAQHDGLEERCSSSDGTTFDRTTSSLPSDSPLFIHVPPNPPSKFSSLSKKLEWDDGDSSRGRHISSWDSALNQSILQFRHLVASATSPSWKALHVPQIAATVSSSNGQSTPPATPGLGSWIDQGKTTLHKRSVKTGEIFRATYEMQLPLELTQSVNMDAFRGSISEPTSLPLWDPLVASSSTLDLIEPSTRIVHTTYKLGWPSASRDSITIQRTYHDDSSLVVIGTSLPKGKHDPSWVRARPPSVRAHVGLWAWYVQLITMENDLGWADQTGGQAGSQGKVLKTTCFFNWSPNGQWAIGASIPTHLPGLLRGLRHYALSGSQTPFMASSSSLGHTKRTDVGKADNVPELVYFSPGEVALDAVNYDPERICMRVDWSVIGTREKKQSGEEQASESSNLENSPQSAQATIVWKIQANSSWEIGLKNRASPDVLDAEISIQVGPARLNDGRYGSGSFIYVRIDTPTPPHDHYLQRYQITIERTTGRASDVRFNGSLCLLSSKVDFPRNQIAPNCVVGDGSNAMSDMSLRTQGTLGDAFSIKSSRERSPSLMSSTSKAVDMTETRARKSTIGSIQQEGTGGRSENQDKALVSLIKRNYIHFTSLLQEPEPKWRRISESKGVTLYSLNSMDKSLLIHRVEAVFVGVGLWDLFAILMNWGARSGWDKARGEAILLEQVNEMTELWRVSQKTRPLRDLLRTTYKANDAMHIFSFSPDPRLFPSVDVGSGPVASKEEASLQGWSLERLSPTTIHVSLIEQVDIRSSTAKSLVQHMHSAMADLGETAINMGGPPVVSRLSGARTTSCRYDADSSTFRVTYEAALIRAVTPIAKIVASNLSSDEALIGETKRGSETPTVIREEKNAIMECQIRCDTDRWASALEIVVDPPPSSFSALRRHALSENGGLWLICEHDSTILPDTKKVNISIKAKPSSPTSRERAVIHLNGREIDIDKEDISPVEVVNLKKQKRSQVTRRPLDQPAAVPLLRRRPTGLPKIKLDDNSEPDESPESPQEAVAPITAPVTWTSSIGGWLNTAAGGAKSIVVPAVKPDIALKQPDPFDAAAIALERLMKIHLDRFSESTTADDQWLVASRNGNAIVEKKMLPFVSTNLPVYRSSRIIQGSSAEDISAIVSSDSHRKSWDAAKLIDIQTLASFGDGVRAQFQTAKMAFPYKNRAFRTVQITARAEGGGYTSPVASSQPSGDAALIFHAATSLFNASSLELDDQAYNVSNTPLGSVILEGWILETLDPYSHDQYPIPSTRCMHVCAIDFGIPLAMNNIANAALPYRILAVEKLLNPDARLPTVMTPPTAVSLPKAMMQAKRLGSNAKYGLLGHQRGSLISLEQKQGDYTRILVEIGPSTTKISGPGKFPAEWYSDESPQQSINLPPTHTRTSSSWSRFTGNRTSIAPQTLEPAPLPKDETLAEIIVESTLGGERYDIGVAIRSHGPSDPRPINLAFTVDSTEEAIPFTIEVEKTTSPVLRGALMDSQAYLVKLVLKGGYTHDPLSQDVNRGPSNHTTVRDLTQFGGLVEMDLRKLPPDGSSHVTFVHRGSSIPIREQSLSTSSLKTSTDSKSAILQWPKLKRIDPALIGKPAVRHLRENIDPIAVAYAFRKSPGTVIQVSKQSSSEEREATTSLIVPEPSLTEKILPVSPVGSRTDRPSTKRMSSLYTYLTKPPRFYWATPPTPNAVVSAVKTPIPEPLEPIVPATEMGMAESDAMAAVPINTAWFTRHALLALMAVALVSFLLGSLSRSLLGDHQDFFTFVPRGSVSLEPDWQEMTRVLEIKVLRWHVVLAVFRGRGL